MPDAIESDTVSVVQPAADAYTRRTVTVDFLYLDTEVCDRCRGTEDALFAAIERIEPILAPLDVSLTVRDIHVGTLAAAESTRLAVSPTIRIDGRDIQPDYVESTCESCGDLCECGEEVACRLWRYRGEEYTTAPVELIVEALVLAIVPTQPLNDRPPEHEASHVSSNVRRFFGSSEDEPSDCGCGC